MKKARVVGWSVTHVELLISRVNREQGIISSPYTQIHDCCGHKAFFFRFLPVVPGTPGQTDYLPFYIL